MKKKTERVRRSACYIGLGFHHTTTHIRTLWRRFFVIIFHAAVNPKSYYGRSYNLRTRPLQEYTRKYILRRHNGTSRVGGIAGKRTRSEINWIGSLAPPCPRPLATCADFWSWFAIRFDGYRRSSSSVRLYLILWHLLLFSLPPGINFISSISLEEKEKK